MRIIIRAICGTLIAAFAAVVIFSLCSESLLPAIQDYMGSSMPEEKNLDVDDIYFNEDDMAE